MRTIFIAIVLLVVAAAGYLFIVGQEDANDTNTTLASYFEDRLVTLGVQDIGQPIEGFDANLLIAAFPGLVAEDFRGVETLEGHYEIEGGAIVFVRDQSMPVSSAERMVSAEGYATLLQNVSRRIAVTPATNADIDMLIDALNTSETIETSLNQGAEVLSVRVVPLEVLEDSRCPADVQCIQAGTVRVRALLSSGLGEAEQDFTLNQTITTEAESVTLIRVSPEAIAGEAIDPSTYRFIFEIKKR